VGDPCSRAARRLLYGDERLESPEDQPLAVEGEVLTNHHVGEARILHHLGVDAIAIPSRLVDDPGEDDGFTALELDAPRKRRELAERGVVTHPLLVIECAVFLPDLARLLRKAPICGQVFHRHGYHEAIYVAHNASSLESIHMFARLPLIIQCVPKRSTSMPKPSAQNVLSKGMVTWPPSGSALKMRFASASVG